MTGVTEYGPIRRGKKLVGFYFSVDGKTSFEKDSDALVRIGGWINATQQMRGFKGGFRTARNGPGFVIVFNQPCDADAFLNQCLLNRSVFDSPQPFFAAIPAMKNRPGHQQLPGDAPRSLSEPLPHGLEKKLKFYRYFTGEGDAD